MSSIERTREPRRALAAWERVVTEAEAAGAMRDPAAAEALVHIARASRDAFVEMRMDRWGTIERDTVRVTRAFLELNAAYTAAINTGDLRWGLTAATELGEVHEAFARILRGSARPPGDEDWTLVYWDEVEARAWMLESKAAKLYESVLTRSFEVRVYDEYTAVALGRLQALDPQAWPALDEDIIRAGFTSGSASGVGYFESVE